MPVWHHLQLSTQTQTIFFFLLFYTWKKTSSESSHMLFDSCLMSLGRNQNSKSLSIKMASAGLKCQAHEWSHASCPWVASAVTVFSGR